MDIKIKICDRVAVEIDQGVPQKGKGLDLFIKKHDIIVIIFKLGPKW